MLKEERAFTLIEMLIVLMIITVLILLIIPNLSDKTASVHDKGCDALKETVQAQVSAYQLDKGALPNSLSELVETNYITEDQTTCQNGAKKLVLDSKGMVKVE